MLNKEGVYLLPEYHKGQDRELRFALKREGRGVKLNELSWDAWVSKAK
jgi:hypothetical protein